MAPQAVLVRMPAFGLEGPGATGWDWPRPWSSSRGFQPHRICRRAADQPAGPCDAIAGMHAAFAALVAVIDRDRTGRGQLVESVMVTPPSTWRRSR